MPKEITILPMQNVMDIAIQEFGTSEAVFEIIELNDIGITSELLPGSKLLIPDNFHKSNKEVVATLKERLIKPATN